MLENGISICISAQKVVFVLQFHGVHIYRYVWVGFKVIRVTNSCSESEPSTYFMFQVWASVGSILKGLWYVDEGTFFYFTFFCIMCHEVLGFYLLNDAFCVKTSFLMKRGILFNGVVYK